MDGKVSGLIGLVVSVMLLSVYATREYYKGREMDEKLKSIETEKKALDVAVDSLNRKLLVNDNRLISEIDSAFVVIGMVDKKMSGVKHVIATRRASIDQLDKSIDDQIDEFNKVQRAE